MFPQNRTDRHLWIVILHTTIPSDPVRGLLFHEIREWFSRTRNGKYILIRGPAISALDGMKSDE